MQRTCSVIDYDSLAEGDAIKGRERYKKGREDERERKFVVKGREKRKRERR